MLQSRHIDFLIKKVSDIIDFDIIKEIEKHIS